MNIIVFDTETIGKVSQDLLNVGYKIIDLNIQTNTYTTLCERDYVVGSLIKNTIYCINDDFVGATKYAKLVNAINDKKAIKRSIKQIFTTMINDIKKHKVIFGYAYNSKFDIDKFKRTSEQLGLANPLDLIPVFDIWGYTYKHIINTEPYKEWAIANNQLTKTGAYVSGTVESVVRYLTENLEFVEDHTALSDVQHETNILVECVRLGADITREVSAYNVKSNVSFTETLVINGERIEVNYTTKSVRNGVVYYK